MRRELLQTDWTCDSFHQLAYDQSAAMTYDSQFANNFAKVEKELLLSHAWNRLQVHFIYTRSLKIK